MLRLRADLCVACEWVLEADHQIRSCQNLFLLLFQDRERFVIVHLRQRLCNQTSAEEITVMNEKTHRVLQQKVVNVHVASGNLFCH